MLNGSHRRDGADGGLGSCGDVDAALAEELVKLFDVLGVACFDGAEDLDR